MCSRGGPLLRGSGTGVETAETLGETAIEGTELEAVEEIDTGLEMEDVAEAGSEEALVVTGEVELEAEAKAGLREVDVCGFC